MDEFLSNLTKQRHTNIHVANKFLKKSKEIMEHLPTFSQSAVWDFFPGSTEIFEDGLTMNQKYLNVPFKIGDFVRD